MSVEVWGMLIAGVVVLAAGFVLAAGRFREASGVGKVLVLAPVFEAAPLVVFAMEHFLDARDLAPMVPGWLPWHLFWVYFVGAALVAAAISFIAWRHVRWSALLLAVLFLIFVVTIDVPDLTTEVHNRIAWVLTVRELVFASGAMVLAGSLIPKGAVLVRIGRAVIAATFVFYAVEHFLFPHNVPGVPLEKLTPTWIPAQMLIAYVVGVVLLVAGVGLLIPGMSRIAAAGAGTVLVLVTVFFYGPIMVAELRTPLAVEGINYVYDTMLFAGTALLAGFPVSQPADGD
jgi:uncharacterized membrane protein